MIRKIRPWLQFFLAGSLALGCDSAPPEHVGPGPSAPPSTSWLFSSHILIQHREAEDTVDTVRTRDDARAFAESLRLQLDDSDASFADLARRYSDDTTTGPGGRLGPYRVDDAREEYLAIVRDLPVDGISPVVETDQGFLIVMRHAVEVATFQHVLVGFEGTQVSRSRRTRAEARALAERALVAARSSRTFESVVEQFSDQGSVDMTITTARGVIESDVEDIVFSLAPGEISEVHETGFGFHVIKRLD